MANVGGGPRAPLAPEQSWLIVSVDINSSQLLRIQMTAVGKTSSRAWMSGKRPPPVLRLIRASEEKLMRPSLICCSTRK
ncbi:hypothetical protein [Undibacterium sp. TC9W]|uniref:hypothetical protein n=1 Tax=Undibacterium sp. TC9W TaxID=3413053 RepID=UPI003BF1BE17